MNKGGKNIYYIAALLLVLVIAIAAYFAMGRGGAPTTSTTTTAPTTITNTSGQTVILKAGGATFPMPQYMVWINEFMKKYPQIKISYEGIGSGAGQSNFFSGVLDFAGSDPPLTHAQWANYSNKVMQIPVIAGAVVVVYNIPGLNGQLRLTPEILALIYNGTIEYWDDASIKAVNPGLNLPHNKIFVVFRADASGTQEIFTTYLNAAAPNYWPSTLVGKSPNYPVKATGRAAGGQGNPGVAAIISQTPYSIGFVEWNYAVQQNMTMALLKNADGNFVLPTIDGIKNALAYASSKLPSDPLADFSNDIKAFINLPGNNTYPIIAVSHLIVWKSYQDKNLAHSIALFIEWVLKEGDKYIVPGYSPIDENLKQIGYKAIAYLNS